MKDESNKPPSHRRAYRREYMRKLYRKLQGDAEKHAEFLKRNREREAKKKRDPGYREKLRNNHRLWMANNREHLRKRSAEYRKNNPWYASYCAARLRCNNPKQTGYEYYGGRGIKMLLSVGDVKFLWLRDRASEMKRPSIDRIDPDDHYSLENSRFIELFDNISRKRKRGSLKKNTKV